MTKVVLFPLNDNEKKGLPADIDLLESAISSVLRNDSFEQLRLLHLNNVLVRVQEQVKQKLRNYEVNVSDATNTPIKDIDSLQNTIQALKEDPNDIDLVYALHLSILDMISILNETDFKKDIYYPWMLRR